MSKRLSGELTWRFILTLGVNMIMIGAGAIVITRFIFPKEAAPPLEERISQAVQGLEDTQLLITDLEGEVERLRNVNEQLRQERLDLESWIRVKEHEDTLKPYFESLTQRSVWEQRILTGISMFGGWLLGLATPYVSKLIGGVLRRR